MSFLESVASGLDKVRETIHETTAPPRGGRSDGPPKLESGFYSSGRMAGFGSDGRSHRPEEEDPRAAYDRGDHRGDGRAGAYAVPGRSRRPEEGRQQGRQDVTETGAPKIETGYYSTGYGNLTSEGTTRTGEEQCDKGYYAVDGVRAACPAGRYGDTVGLSSADCSGECSTGYFCPEGSTGPQQDSCGVGQYPAQYYCPVGTTERIVVDDGGSRLRIQELTCTVPEQGIFSPLLVGKLGKFPHFFI